MRPMAESRLVSSNSSVTNFWSAPRSPRNRSSVRGQPTVAIREVRAEDVLHGPRRLLVGGRRLGHELLELAPDDVRVHRRRGVLEGEEADAQRALRDGGTLRLVALREGGGERAVHEDEPLDQDALAVDAHGRRAGDGPQGAAEGLGSGTIRASMARILDPPRAT